jgi:hypothetical protein
VETCDVLIVGGGLGGVAAALGAARRGLRVLVTEETDWIGGQLTSQGVPPDEHPWIERFGATRSYRAVRDGIREHYRRWYPLTPDALADPELNPGKGKVSRLCHEPRVAASVLESMVSPYLTSGRMRILYRHVAVEVETSGDTITSVHLQGPEHRVEVRARYVLDATELGDVLAVGDVEHVTGFESRAETGEPSAPDEAQPSNMQAFSWVFAIEYREGEDHTIERPADYDFWRSYQPDYWPGPLLGLTAPDPRTLEPLERRFVPHEPVGEIVADQSLDPGDRELWAFRRIVSRDVFEPGFCDSEVTIVNWPMIDYLPGALIGVDDDEKQRHLQGSRDLAASMLYWLQTEAPRPDGGRGWPGLRLRPDVMGTDDGFAKAPYIRESRRIRAQYTVVEQDVSLAVRGEAGAVSYPDSVGIGMYRIDLHPSTGGDNYIDVASCPFQIPLGALIPVRVENLLAAGKNIGTTHITNGCFRLHPVEWNVGEVAGLLASYCLERELAPAAVRNDPASLAEFQELLVAEGIELAWPDDPDVRPY